jgi:Tfp pilus assembly protein PilV
VNRRRARGFSFIEVLIALGLLAMVLISMTSLFATGRRQVKSGRTTSEALAVARSILEEMEGWGFDQTYRAYGLDGLATSYTVDTRTNSYAAKWQPQLDSKLENSFAAIVIASIETGGIVPPISASNGLRVVVTIHWSEGQRARSVDLIGVKT